MSNYKDRFYIVRTYENRKSQEFTNIGILAVQEGKAGYKLLTEEHQRELIRTGFVSELSVVRAIYEFSEMARSGLDSVRDGEYLEFSSELQCDKDQTISDLYQQYIGYKYRAQIPEKRKDGDTVLKDLKDSNNPLQMSRLQVRALSDERANRIFSCLRWPENEGNPVCIACGAKTGQTGITGRIQWRCSHCKQIYSLKSKTIFSNFKLNSQQILELIIAFKKNPNRSIRALEQELGISWSSLSRVGKLIRESMENDFLIPTFSDERLEEIKAKVKRKDQSRAKKPSRKFTKTVKAREENVVLESKVANYILQGNYCAKREDVTRCFADRNAWNFFKRLSSLPRNEVERRASAF